MRLLSRASHFSVHVLSACRSRACFLCVCLLCVNLICACAPTASNRTPRQTSKEPARPMSTREFLLDTLVTVTIYDKIDQDAARAATRAAMDEIARLESVLSAAAEDSDPARLAINAGEDFIDVSEDTIYLLNEGARFSAISAGAFDCTVGPLVALWSIRESGGYYPTDAQLKEALSLIDYQSVLIRGDNQVMLMYPGMRLDFGAIAKGYIADRVKTLLLADGVKCGLIDLGGNIVLFGQKPDGAPFRVGARDPYGVPGEYFGVFTVSDKSLVSSGSYERFFIHDGKAYHHIFDVSTGFPADNELIQVTIVSDSSTEGEGYSTAAFLLGLEWGMALVGKADGIEAVFVTKDKQVYITSGIKDQFEITSDEYKLASL